MRGECNPNKHCADRKGAQKRLKQEKNDKNRVQAMAAAAFSSFSEVNLERCTMCMDSLKLSLHIRYVQSHIRLLDIIYIIYILYI